MKKIMYAEAIYKKNKGLECILIGDTHKLDNSSNTVQAIKDKTPMSFERINDAIKDILSELEYIDFWNSIKIYKVGC